MVGLLLGVPIAVVGVRLGGAPSLESSAPATPSVVEACRLQPSGGPTGRRLSVTLQGEVLTFVGLSEGQFCMGDPEPGPLTFEDFKRPQHPVQVTGFLLGQSEVTQAQWRAVVQAAKAAQDKDAAALMEAPSHFTGDKLPVERVSWCDAARFANALSRLDGRAAVYEITIDEADPKSCTSRWRAGADGYRLPTEAEWEYAARAGTTTTYATGDDEAAVARLAWYGAWPENTDGNSGGTTHEVCTTPEKPWGLCDLYGNVSEWTFDVYFRRAYRGRGPGLTVDPGFVSVPIDGSYPRVTRGGGWTAWPEFMDAAGRSAFLPSEAYLTFGLRLVLPSPERP